MNVTRIKIFFCALVLVVLISCSMSKVLYNNADIFLFYWFDDYFDLNEEQHSDLKKRIESLFEWHRESELPRIILFLEELKSRYEKKIKEEDISWTRSQFEELWERVLRHVENDLVSFLLTIERDQILRMNKKLIERDDQLIKQSKMDPNELRETILDWVYETLEDWLGYLEPDQKREIATWVKPDFYWITTKLKNRKKFRSDLSHLLQIKKSMKENLHHWIYHPESQWTNEFKKHIESKKQEWVGFILKVDDITLSHQRKHATNELQYYIDDFRDLKKK